MKTTTLMLFIGILALSVPGQEGSDIPKLLDEYKEAFKVWQTEVREARQKRLPRKEWPKRPAVKFYPLVKVAVASVPEGSDEAGQGLAWMLQNIRGTRLNYKKALVKQQTLADRLMKHHVDQACMLAVARFFSGPPKAKKGAPDYRSLYAGCLRTILEKNQNVKVRVQAHYSLANCLASKYMKPTAVELEEAHMALKTLLQKHADAPLAKRATRFLYELEHLQIGMKAPDFETTDVDGVAFKLSDYHGKVVVLDFWGFW